MADCKMLDIIVVGYAPQQGAKAALLKRNRVNLYKTRHNNRCSAMKLESSKTE
jgi:hypothetical protein